MQIADIQRARRPSFAQHTDFRGAGIIRESGIPGQAELRIDQEWGRLRTWPATCSMPARRVLLAATHVPYKGAEALNDLLAGRVVQFMFATIPSVIQHIQRGRAGAHCGQQLEAITLAAFRLRR